MDLNGKIVTTMTSSPSGKMRVIGMIEGAKLTIRDGHGYERTMCAAVLEPADEAQCAAYWKVRAMTAERSGYGIMPGKAGS